MLEHTRYYFWILSSISLMWQHHKSRRKGNTSASHDHPFVYCIYILLFGSRGKFLPIPYFTQTLSNHPRKISSKQLIRRYILLKTAILLNLCQRGLLSLWQQEKTIVSCIFLNVIYLLILTNENVSMNFFVLFIYLSISFHSTNCYFYTNKMRGGLGWRRRCRTQGGWRSDCISDHKFSQWVLVLSLLFIGNE